MKNWLLIVLLFVVSASFAQTNLPFWNDVQAFKKQDSISFPAAGQILFIGSSSFTKWKDINEYFPGKKILNRAFGGSTIADLIQYRYDVLFPYNPRQIVMYCGENDFASSDTVTVEMVVQRFKTFYKFIRDKYPSIPFAYVSMKPSPSRMHLVKKFEAANGMIASYLKGFKNTAYIDIFSNMLLPNGRPKPEIYVSDSLHMNALGYAIWQKAFKKYLK